MDHREFTLVSGLKPYDGINLSLNPPRFTQSNHHAHIVQHLIKCYYPVAAADISLPRRPRERGKAQLAAYLKSERLDEGLRLLLIHTYACAMMTCMHENQERNTHA